MSELSLQLHAQDNTLVSIMLDEILCIWACMQDNIKIGNILEEIPVEILKTQDNIELGD